MVKEAGIGSIDILPQAINDRERELVMALQTYMGNTSNAIAAVLRPHVLNIDGDYTIEGGESTILVDATGAAVTVTLLSAAKFKGKIFTIKKIDGSGNAVTVEPDGSEQIEFASNLSLAAQGDSCRIQSDGLAWYII